MALFVVVATFVSGCLSDSDSPDTNSSVGSPTQNGAPTISGNPPSTIVMDESWSFTPSASDPDDDALTFSIENKPGWATFESSTGRISGTPTMGDIGQYGNVIITVSDGSLSASLKSFSVQVVQAANGSVTFSWTAPTQNDDGTTLMNLAGYRIYYGKSIGNYPNKISIDSPGVTTYVVENLAPYTYYFVASAVNDNDVESALTSPVSKQIL